MQKNIQKEIKKEIRSGLKDEELTLIIVSHNDESEIQWIKPQKEFRYKGEMFDVVRVKYKNEKKYYYCINDIKEKRLIAAFNKNHKSKKGNEKRMKNRSNNQYFQSFLIKIKDNCSIHLYFVRCDIKYKSNIIDILSPPPKS